MSKPIFYQGQEVGCLMYGEGVVSKITSDDFPIEIIFSNHPDKTYSLDGKYNRQTLPTLYPIDQYRQIIANLPAPQPEAWKPKPGEWILAWDQEAFSCALLCRFVNFDRGRYKITADGMEFSYDHCAPFTGELPDHFKEVHS